MNDEFDKYITVSELNKLKDILNIKLIANSCNINYERLHRLIKLNSELLIEERVKITQYLNDKKIYFKKNKS